MKKLAIILAAVTFASVAHADETAISLDPVYSNTVRTECTTAQAGGGWLGPALGAIIGGGAGSQVGKGSGQAAAAAIGATLGAQAGTAMSSGQQARQECREVAERNLTGYSVKTNFGQRVFVPADMMQRVVR